MSERDPQSRWQGSENSPVAVVLLRFERSSRRDDLSANGGWPDPTSVTNLNLSFLLRHAGIFVPPLPSSPEERLRNQDANGYGTSGILYFTNAVHHSLPYGQKLTPAEVSKAAELLRPQLLHRKIIAVCGGDTFRVVKTALELSTSECETSGVQRTWGDLDIFALPHPSFGGNRNLQYHLDGWASFGQRVRSRFPHLIR